jgi:hypothetical protein
MTAQVSHEMDFQNANGGQNQPIVTAVPTGKY